MYTDAMFTRPFPKQICHKMLDARTSLRQCDVLVLRVKREVNVKEKSSQQRQLPIWKRITVWNSEVKVTHSDTCKLKKICKFKLLFHIMLALGEAKEFQMAEQ